MMDIISQVASISLAVLSILIAVYSRLINRRKLNQVKTQYHDILSRLSHKNLQFGQLIEEKADSEMDKESIAIIYDLFEIWTNYKSLESSSDADIYSELFIPYVETGELKFARLIGYPPKVPGDIPMSMDFYKESIKYLLTSGKGFTIVNEVLKSDLNFKPVNNEEFENRLDYESILVIPIADFYSKEKHKTTSGIFVSRSNKKNVFKKEDFEIIHSITHNVSKYLSKIKIDYQEILNN